MNQACTGPGWMSAVRVIRRGRQPTHADKRAMAFYTANDPALTLNVYRLGCPRTV